MPRSVASLARTSAARCWTSSGRAASARSILSRTRGCFGSHYLVLARGVRGASLGRNWPRRARRFSRPA
eukprot:3449279-Alexandrium_andersonii.AAC.1